MLEPLAFRIRPKNINEIIGQEHLVGENGFLSNSIKEETPISFILYGSPGCGKTTIAEAYANSLKLKYIKINAVNSNKKDLENAINETIYNKPIILIIDEVHRLNKDKQDILLPYIENGSIYLIGATTSNPLISINKALRSRTHLLEVKKLKINDIILGINRAIKVDKKINNINITENAKNYIASSSNGDFRFALNYLEIAYITFKNEEIDLEKIKSIIKVSNFGIDKNEDEHYNLVSALQKSIRGSDVNAALYYLTRLALNNDLESIARRLLITAYEDIGIANPQACARCKIAIDSAKDVGFPEAIIPLSVSVIELCLSLKSKVAENAVIKAKEEIISRPLDVLDYLKYTRVLTDDELAYPYDNPKIWVHMQYLPEIIKNIEFYEPNLNTKSSFEKVLNENYKLLKNIKRSSDLKTLKEIYKK